MVNQLALDNLTCQLYNNEEHGYSIAPTGITAILKQHKMVHMCLRCIMNAFFVPGDQNINWKHINHSVFARNKSSSYVPEWYGGRCKVARPGL